MAAELTLLDEHRLARRGGRVRPQDVEQARARMAKRLAAVPEEIAYPDLPVAARREDLLAAIRDHQVVVVAGETGSGKTTQLPKLCLELGRGVRGAIAHTQPRRIAARSVAERIASELGVPLGTTVGFSVRFDDRSGRDTLVRLMTDGLLLAEVRHDPLLRRYDTVIVDEAHERSLNIDFLLGYLHRLLPQRPDLKVIITSATIDPGRFAEHFGGAPVVEVSGRTFPVEVRYEPPEEGVEVVDAIADAVDGLVRERLEDVLVFLSGEREIRDTADVLRGRLGDEVEVLPLYARLSGAEQQRIFRRGKGGRRVVLATNVAETSLTVPGIRSVVDPGLARISRYSARLKVQRLPIEPVSQASADQRKGRCGRTSEGVCVRLYGEDDLLGRPRFTDPEILRTNLASVILQMAALGLGAVEDFPFLDPPDARQVRDGVALLEELRAIERQGAELSLTPLGRRLARLPVDPRLARIVLEGDRLGCATEACVLAAALSVQDPRERPAEQQAQADQQHARFRDETSDFLGWLALWRHLEARGDALSGSAFRRECKREFLHYLRVREWQDLVGQVRRAAEEVGVTLNTEPAEPHLVHQAVLSGFLSHLGLKDARRRGEYQGARGSRFALWPGSGLKGHPAWVVAAELVETSRLFGRTAAVIDPAWAEPLAEHLVSRSVGEPRWDRRRAAAVATERVTLFGLPIVTGRTVSYAAIDPAGARELFLRSALVAGDWDARHAFREENAKRLTEVEALEQRTRQAVPIGDEDLFRFFDERVPATVTSARAFERWWKDERRRSPDLLVFPRDLLVPGGLDLAGRPATWRQGDLELQLSYRFEPGAEGDGVTVHVPLRALARVRAQPFEWLVPALREELVVALLRGLPKEHRRALLPVPETARAVLARVRPRKEPLLEALARELGAVRGVRVAPEDFDRSKLPPHLVMRFRIEGERGELVAEGDDLDALRERLRPKLREELTRAASALERHGLREWPGGAIPQVVALPGTGGSVRGFPSLVDEGEAGVGVLVHESAPAARRHHRLGTRRLLLETTPTIARTTLKHLSQGEQLRLATAPHGSFAAVVADARVAAVDHLVREAGGPAWDAEGFARLRADVAAALDETVLRALRGVVEVLEAERAVRRRLEELTDPRFAESTRDVAVGLARLLPPGFLTAHGLARLPDLPRYVRAAEHRLERLPTQLAADRDRMATIHELEVLAAALPRPSRKVRWMLEELRVSQFAQHLGVRGAVSAKKVRAAIAEAAAPRG